MSQAEIRSARLDDIPALCELFVQSHMFHVNAFPNRLRPTSTDWNTIGLPKAVKDILNDPKATIFVAAVSTELVGLVDIYIREDKGEEGRSPLRYGHVQNLIVFRTFAFQHK